MHWSGEREGGEPAAQSTQDHAQIRARTGQRQGEAITGMKSASCQCPRDAGLIRRTVGGVKEWWIHKKFARRRVRSA